MQINPEHRLTAAVIEQLGQCPDRRLQQISGALIRHLHDFIREVELQPEEWLGAIRFLTRTGQACDDKRQEFVLLSDLLGASMLVDQMANRKPAGATASSVLGPFYVEGAPERANGADLAALPGPRVHVSGTVRDLAGAPIASALLDVWQTAPNGLYHVQDKDQPEHHLCGKLRSRADGSYDFITLEPVSYPIPTDGPAGQYLQAMGRHPYRPAHLHFIVTAPGYQPLVTQLFTAGDPYLDSDAVFGVKPELVIEYQRQADGNMGVAFDFVLEPVQAR
ncbi:6-chlorohydroxyquinol-1,2-dioxygenase [Duganella sp. FT92W]|uniref:6-chlorohydroxyquinol-1,2-dioxygenase n=1 Tax=Pseudoduganella rivuli TaxID=2666085 RepID=A0A7X2IIF7_9BURK|nr:intradiol ring-cleavage dioxygenase [Pseudoduganella rivuli]MRV70464.1 6-chlorohydroxyquinol-1,2-dioxygenase [Pseudoduganella rivuli]